MCNISLLFLNLCQIDFNKVNVEMLCTNASLLFLCYIIDDI